MLGRSEALHLIVGIFASRRIFEAWGKNPEQAKSLELRAAMSLSRLWQRQGKRDQALKLLQQIYHWFTEGANTVDLQEAQSLLQEMAPS